MVNKKKKESFSWKGSMFVINKKPFYILLIVISFFIGFGVLNSTRERFLSKNGLQTKAIVYKVKKVGGKGVVRCFYQFKTDGNQYEGFVDNDFYKEGDSILVSYRSDKPSYNRDYNYIKKHY